MRETLEIIRAAANRHGLNLVAAVPVERYDETVPSASRASQIAPRARSIVAIANGGGVFWRAYQKHLAANPGWDARENPLDDFTREIVEREITAPLDRRAIPFNTIYPFVSAAPAVPALNFMHLGKIAGLGGPSIIGVVVHPAYGPWIAFRAAILLEEPIDSPGEAVGFDPCPGCVSRSCIDACPVRAVSFPNGWDVPACLTYRVENESDCSGGCHARIGCVLGPEHRYPDDELAYHQMRAVRAMRPYYETMIKPKRAK